MHSLFARVLAPALMLSVASCASVSEPRERFAHELVRSDPTVLSRAPVGLVLVEEGRWSNADNLSVAIEQLVGCEDGVRDAVSTTRVVTRETRDLALEAGAGGVLFLSGGLLYAGAATFSTETPAGVEASPQQAAAIWGSLSLVGGAVLLGHAVYVAAQGGDRVSAPYRGTNVRSAGRPLRVCSRSPAGPGMVRAVVGERSMPVAFIQSGGDVTARPRESALRLCGDAADMDSTAILEFVLAKDADLTVELGRYPLKRCVTITVGGEMLMAAEATLGQASPAPAMVEAAEGVNDVERLAQSLPSTDPERPALLARVVSARRKAAARAAELLEPATEQAREAIEKDFANAVGPTALALRLAHLSGNSAPTWSTLYESFAARARGAGLSGYRHVHQLLEADPLTRSCLNGAASCPNGISSSEARSALSPFAVAIALTIRKQGEALRSTTAAITKQVDAKSVKASDALEEKMRIFREVCAYPELLDAVKHACAELSVADDALTTEIRAKGDEMGRVRAEETERAKQR
jgi:hypothetical protein